MGTATASSPRGGVSSGAWPLLPDYSYSGPGGDSPKGISVTVNPTAGTGAFRQGGINVQVDRAAGEADTVWDGNPDCAIKVISTTRATGNVAGQGAVRGIDVQARNRGTNVGWVNGININARNDSGKVASSLWGAMIRVENYGTVNDDIVGLDVNLSDENDTGTHTKHGILVRNTDQSAQAAANAAIKVSHTSTNGFTAFAELATDAGDGAVASIATPAGDTTEALIIKIGANLRYIPVYAAVTF